VHGKRLIALQTFLAGAAAVLSSFAGAGIIVFIATGKNQ